MTNKTNRQSGSLDPLVAALKVTKRRVSQLLAEGMPIDPAAAVKWREQKQAGDGTPEQLRRERIELVREQKRKIQLENKVRSGELVSAAAMQQSAMNAAAVAKNRLWKMTNDLPGRLEGLGAPQIQRILRDEIMAALVELSDPKSYIPAG